MKSGAQHRVIKGFDEPDALPRSLDEAERWQIENKTWWERNPMRYDWGEEIEPQEFSREFYEEIDRRFFENAAEYLPREDTPFDSLIRFSELDGENVLEIGIGNGSHAELIARRAGRFTGIDITSYAVKSVTERFRLKSIPGVIRQMDAEEMDFGDDTLDFIWSWGVIHHSANTERVICEMHRILKPGGRAVIMVYHRDWWNYYCMGLVRGIISGEFTKTHSLHQSVQRTTDGAIARYYTPREIRKLTADRFDCERVFTLGPKSDVLALPQSIRRYVAPLMPNWLNRAMTRYLRMGSFLIAELQKK